MYSLRLFAVARNSRCILCAVSLGLFLVPLASKKMCFPLHLVPRAVVRHGQHPGLAVRPAAQRVRRSPGPADESGHCAGRGGGCGHGHAAPVCSHTVSTCTVTHCNTP